MNTCCNSDFGLSNGTNMIEHIAQYYGQIRTVNSPVTASNPTWMVCSKSEGEEISGLSLSRSFFLPPAGKGQGSKCGSSTVMHVRFFFTVYVSMYVSILHISHLSQRQTWRWSCLWTSSPPVQTAAAESCDWLTVSPWVLLLGCSSWQGGRGACPHTLRCHTSTHTCTCAHEKIHTQITMHTRNTACLLNVESLVHFFLFFLGFFYISQYWPKLYMLAKNATENQPEIKPTLHRKRNNLRNTHKDPTNPYMPQAVDQHWVKERVWTGSNASRTKWRVESRSMLQMSEEGKEAEEQSERVVYPRDLKGEAWRSGQKGGAAEQCETSETWCRQSVKDDTLQFWSTCTWL